MTDYVTLPPVTFSPYTSEPPIRLDGPFEKAIPTEFAVPGRAGTDGQSAYELAVENGFVGTEEAWLESLASAALPGMGYWVLKADSSTTFPARSTVPSWWNGPVQFDSTAYLNHSDPTDVVVGDQHLKRTS